MDTNWTKIGSSEQFPEDLGSCVLVDGVQIAVFNLNDDQKWYAVQNFNPQNERMVLSRGIVVYDVKEEAGELFVKAS